MEGLEGTLDRPVVRGTLAVAFIALAGSDVDLAALKGKVVQVESWAESQRIPGPLELSLSFLGHFPKQLRGI